VPKWAAALLVCSAVLSVVTAAAAAPHRIAVLQPDAELHRALVLALSPWGVETLRDDTPPPSSPPEALELAARLARQTEVEAVVWVSRTDAGSLVWVFDAHAGEVTTRMLDEVPPFDSAAAAAVALSVKTVLRASVVAPPAERFGAPPVSRRRERVFALEAGAGGGPIGSEQFDIKFELAAVLWLAAARRLGLSLEVAYGPELELEGNGFRGSYRDIATGGRARFRILSSALSFGFSLGAAAHWTTLHGSLPEDTVERSVSRVNASIDGELSVALSVGRGVYFGAAIGVAYFPTYRRYLVLGEPIFSPWPLAPNLGAYFGVEVF
jgi:hypothetical protein